MRTILLLLLLVWPAFVAAAETPSFARHIRPFLNRYCSECHSGDDADGGFRVDSFKALLTGGDHGPALVAGKPESSRLVRMVEGKTRPSMPPKRSRQPAPEEIGLLQAWIAAGATDDSGSVRTVVLPQIKPRSPRAAPVAALAYRPDGKLLAAGVQSEVVLIDPTNGEVQGRRTAQGGRVTALAYSPNGEMLAVACGSAGAAGEIRLYTTGFNGLPAEQPSLVFTAHADLIHALAFHPDNKSLASCGYDRLIRIWDVATGKRLQHLTDHSDAVQAVAFSPDGRLLASAGADRAVKVWDVASGKRLFTLAEATDWVYCLAWNPRNQQLAAAGVDRSIRVWEISEQHGKLLHAVFAHEGPISRLVYSADGQSLFSLSEDRTLKVWDAVRFTERQVHPAQPDTPLALAVRPDQKQLALGRYDGVLLLLDPNTGKAQNQPLPIKPKPPVLDRVVPGNGVRGQSLKLKLEGKNLPLDTEIISTLAGLKTRILSVGPTGLEVQADIPANTAAGVYSIQVKTLGGQSAAVSLTVDLFPPVLETEMRASPRTAAKVKLPAALVGKISQAGSIDYFRFDAGAGQEIGVQVLSSVLGSKLQPFLQLHDDSGLLLMESSNGLLGFICPQAGTYALSIRDQDYNGDPSFSYRIQVGPIPVVLGVFPLGVQRGSEAEVQLEGVNLGSRRRVRVQAPAEAAVGSRLPVPVDVPGGPVLGNPTVVIGELPEVLTPEKPLVAPALANGRLAAAGAVDSWRIGAHKGETLLVEITARRLGSPLDSVIEITDDQGQLVPRATLRCLAKTYTTFRDHDSSSPGIRMETWNDLAVNDYLLVGNELVRIRALPKNPDDDCQLFSEGGQRRGYLGTTPTFHPMGEPMYKAAIHPPGTRFAPNGLPLVTLFYRNDDGGGNLGKDSQLIFDPPADGTYRVRVRDARGQGGALYSYRLTIRPPRPGFSLRFSPTKPSISKGSAAPINVTAERSEGYEGLIELRLDNLPPGLSAPATTIPGGENSTSFALFASPDMKMPATAKPLRLVGWAPIGGQEVQHTVDGDVPVLIEPGDLVTTTHQGEVSIRPGGQVRLTVAIERRNGFTGRVPIEVRGLPHGVRVLDIGLNGILVTPLETTRTMVLYADPWVEPTTHPFVVFARREGKNTEHAARSVLLRVEK